VEGRADEVIVSGGENISPAEVEAVLESHPAVSEAVVVGMASARWGARPAAALVPSGQRLATDDELRLLCRSELAAFKAPDVYVWCRELPRSALGKPQRAEIASLVREMMTAPARSQEIEPAEAREQRLGCALGWKSSCDTKACTSGKPMPVRSTSKKRAVTE
jgi:acyl-CoA synthetase (AMP-forming)/AMP-acid ligase II